MSFLQLVKCHDLATFPRHAQVGHRKSDTLAGVNDSTDPSVIIILLWFDHQDNVWIVLQSRIQYIDKRILLYQCVSIDGNRFVVDDDCLDLIVIIPLKTPVYTLYCCNWTMKFFPGCGLVYTKNRPPLLHPSAPFPYSAVQSILHDSLE